MITRKRCESRDPLDELLPYRTRLRFVDDLTAFLFFTLWFQTIYVALDSCLIMIVSNVVVASQETSRSLGGCMHHRRRIEERTEK